MNLFKNSKKILQFAFQEKKKKFFFIVIGLIILGFIEVLGIASIGPLMAVVTNEELIFNNIYLKKIYYMFSFNSKNQFIVFLGFICFSTVAFSNIFNAIMIWQTTLFAKLQGYIISYKLYEKYLFNDYSIFLNRNSSEIEKNILSEVKRTVDGIILPILQLISKFFVTISIFIFLIIFNPTITIPIIIILSLSYFLVFYFLKDIQTRIGLESTKTVLSRFKIINESLYGIKEIKLKSAENIYLRLFSKPAKREAILDTKGTLISNLPRFLIETVIIMILVITIIYLTYEEQVSNSGLMPIFAIYALAGIRLMPSIQQIYLSSAMIKYNLPAFELLINDFNRVQIINPLSKKRFEDFSFNNNIKLNDISFKYENSNNLVLNKINFKIKKNSIIGIVGRTGSGKSTLIDLFCGLLNPTRGCFFIDDRKYVNLNIDKWKHIIGYVPQSIRLNDDTIASNIAFPFSKNEINMDKVIECSKKSNLHEYVISLPNGYETVIGEKGVRLSGGQRQRIAISRSLYSDPQILIFDEATSALDNITENIILDTINVLSNKITLIIISHRLKTLKKCDNIIYIKDQTINDQGTYSYLSQTNENFKKLKQ